MKRHIRLNRLGQGTPEDRIELETKIVYLEHTVDTLNEVVVEQGQSLDLLARRLESVENRLRSREEGQVGESRNLADEKPPHY